MLEGKTIKLSQCQVWHNYSIPYRCFGAAFRKEERVRLDRTVNSMQKETVVLSDMQETSSPGNFANTQGGVIFFIDIWFLLSL